MSRLVFGVDDAPSESGERMAYVARAGCGHIVIAQADSRPGALADFVSYLTPGLTVERVTSQSVRDEGFCSCPRATQSVLGL